MKKFLFLLVLSVVSLWGMAQKIYDPVLDPDVVINRQSSIVDGQSYMWYPGQLAAYRQQWLLERSQERCVNVGYVGKFNPMQEVTWFKVNLTAKEATTLEFATAGAQRVEITDNGKAY